MKNKLITLTAEEAKYGSDKGDGGPFGAIITDKTGEIISIKHNTVLKDKDPTAHAEVNAIREACKVLGTHELSDCTIYSSCEPCPMCLSAIIWSNIKHVYYSSTRKDAEEIGYRDDAIYEYLAGKNNIIDKEQIENKECEEVLKNYNKEIY